MAREEYPLGVTMSKEINIDFMALFMELLDKLVLIILTGIICAMLTFLACETVISLDYESTTAIYIMPQSNDATMSYASIQVGSLITTDYLEMITSRDLIEGTIAYFGLEDKETYKTFTKKVTVDNPRDTRIIYISIEDDDPYMARNMVEYLRDRAIEAFGTGMGIEGITIFQKANLPTEPVHSAIFWAVIIGLLSAVLAAGFVIVRYIIIDKIVSADDIENRLHYPVLGTIAYEKKYRRGGKE